MTKEAISGVVNWARIKTDIKSIVATTNKDNPASIHIF
ncbi:GNAT family N-acetyltransferase [Pararhodonellum marinum]|nr:GNAT family N-acetyltransferase [Pararhodonellum marinum]